MRLIEIIGPTKDLSTILLSSKAGADDRNLVSKLTDLMEKCLILDPSKRIKVVEALKHPLFQSTHTHSHNSHNSHNHTHNHSNSKNFHTITTTNKK